MQVRREAFEPAHRLSILVRAARLHDGRRCPRRSLRLWDAPHPAPGPPIATAASTLSSAFDSSYGPPLFVLLGKMDPARPGCDRFKNLSNGVELLSCRTTIRHHARDRQHRSHAVNRARSTKQRLGLSLPNLVLATKISKGVHFYHQFLVPVTA